MTDKEAKEVLKELPDRILGVIIPSDKPYDYKLSIKLAIEAIENEIKIKKIVERALRSSDAINSFKAKSIEEIAEILGVVIEDEEPESNENQITFDDILEEE